ncbi:MAG: hypothetical protein KDA44_09365 [Planctomycetales bacterium]|nr:hypothetical protein [Planctomycetales bacterium]
MRSALAVAQTAYQRCPGCGAVAVLPCLACRDKRYREQLDLLVPIPVAYRRATGEPPPRSIERAATVGAHGLQLQAEIRAGELCTTPRRMTAYLAALTEAKQEQWGCSETDPTPTEIAERSAAVRAAWSEHERATRGAWMFQAAPVCVVEVSVAELTADRAAGVA